MFKKLTFKFARVVEVCWIWIANSLCCIINGEACVWRHYSDKQNDETQKRWCFLKPPFLKQEFCLLPFLSEYVVWLSRGSINFRPRALFNFGLEKRTWRLLFCSLRPSSDAVLHKSGIECKLGRTKDFAYLYSIRLIQTRRLVEFSHVIKIKFPFTRITSIQLWCHLLWLSIGKRNCSPKERRSACSIQSWHAKSSVSRAHFHWRDRICK